jgi:hypothetical protein
MDLPQRFWLNQIVKRDLDGSGESATQNKRGQMKPSAPSHITAD